VQANLRLALEQVIDLRAELAQLTGAEPASEQAADGEPILSFDQALREVPALLDMQDLLGQPDDSSLRNEKEISAIIQELRQPMSSILGYTDFLLGESTGVLGELQRKYLERIRASVERLGGLADDLIQLTEQETNSSRLRPATVVLDQMIDKAVAGTKDQLSKKNILLELNIPDHLPDLQADQPALQQVLDSLLQNAVNCTAAGGKVNIQASGKERARARLYPGGFPIPAATSKRRTCCLSRVFKMIKTESRATTNQSTLLSQGSGRSHGGRIWVD
jgi:signal transduction histidine kinase